MSALGSLERFDEKDPILKNEDRAECLQSEWALEILKDIFVRDVERPV